MKVQEAKEVDLEQEPGTETFELLELFGQFFLAAKRAKKKGGWLRFVRSPRHFLRFYFGYCWPGSSSVGVPAVKF